MNDYIKLHRDTADAYELVQKHGAENCEIYFCCSDNVNVWFSTRDPRFVDGYFYSATLLDKLIPWTCVEDIPRNVSYTIKGCKDPMFLDYISVDPRGVIRLKFKDHDKKYTLKEAFATLLHGDNLERCGRKEARQPWTSYKDVPLDALYCLRETGDVRTLDEIQIYNDGSCNTVFNGKYYALEEMRNQFNYYKNNKEWVTCEKV